MPNILNTSSGINGKTVVVAESPATVSGLLTFSRGTSPPFAVNSGADTVPNLDADLLDGEEGTDYHDATQLTGTLADARFPATLPVASGVNLTALNATNLASGTVADARLSANIPKKDAANTFAEIITASKGVQFPAVQVPSADVNCLDDYEEGTWTPVIGGAGGQSGQAYSGQTGTYVKIGGLVHVTFIATLTTKGTITGAVQIQGLPFPVGGAAANAIIPYYIGLNTSWVTIGGHAFNASSAINLYGNTAAAVTVAPLATGDISNTTEIRGSMTYKV